MNKSIFLLVFFFYFFTTSISYSASFDCDKATTFVEETICANLNLSSLDNELAFFYGNALLNASNKENLKEEQKAWLKKINKICKDTSCIEKDYQNRINTLTSIVKNLCKNMDTFQCADKYFRFDGKVINPKIIKEFSTWISDTGDQIISIDLNNSQKSDRFSVDTQIRNNGVVFYEIDTEFEKFEFGYHYIGKTTSGVHIVSTYENDGGSMVVRDILLFRFVIDYSVDTNVDILNNGTVKNTVPRVLIKKVGSLGLGDRWGGNLSVKDNYLIIGKDVGWFSSNPDYKDRQQERKILIDIK